MLNLHYCNLSDDCYTCRVPFCPYEKLDDYVQDECADNYDDEEDQDDGW